MKRIVALILAIAFIVTGIFFAIYAGAKTKSGAASAGKEAPKDFHSVQVIRRGEPDRPYKELGPIEVKGDPDTPEAELIVDMKQQAAAMGADAVMVKEIGKKLSGSTTPEVYCPSGKMSECVSTKKRQDTQIKASGTAIKFLDKK